MIKHFEMDLEKRFANFERRAISNGKHSAIIEKMAACRSKKLFSQIKIGNESIKKYLMNHIK
mgnify:CR=1 FL=1